MRPVLQTRFGDPMGNCWEACLASILAVELDEVPDPRPSYGELNSWLHSTFPILGWCRCQDSKSSCRRSPASSCLSNGGKTHDTAQMDPQNPKTRAMLLL